MAVNGLAWHCKMEKMMGISPAKRPTLIKGPAIFLAQFMSDEAPFNCLDDAARTMGEMGYRGLQLHSNDPRCMNLELAASSKDYCDELRGICAKYGIEITELSTHIQGQLLAVHPAYDLMFDGQYAVIQPHERNGRMISCCSLPKPVPIWGWTGTLLFQVRWPGLMSTLGRSGQRG
jgi:sugar phosphate isomerase/epimerase